MLRLPLCLQAAHVVSRRRRSRSRRRGKHGGYTLGVTSPPPTAEKARGGDHRHIHAVV